MRAVGDRGDRRHILLVDDLELNRVLAAAILGNASYDVDCVSDGPAAYVALEGADYDLVLLNLGVPGLDRLDRIVGACRDKGVDAPKLASLSIRARDHRRNTSAVALDAHIVRSAVPADLVSAVERVLAAPMVWRREAYADLVAQLGPVRMNALLVELLGSTEAMMETIAVDADAVVALDRQAHDLASTSGMFGFDALSEACFAVMHTKEGAGRRLVIDTLVDALRRANSVIRAATEPDTFAMAA